MDYILEMKNISKNFPGVKALDNVQFSLKAGEVHVLMGENGAGKSTLMKILGGLYHPDSGEIWINGINTRIHSPYDALERGIAMIYQELNSIPDMTIAENIYIGREPSLFRFGLLNKKKMNDDAIGMFPYLGLDFNPKKRMGDLSVAERQMIEITKAISFKSKIIIMDEPTSAITDKEVDKLFEVIQKLKSDGVGIIYISHKMDEIFKIADRITVLRDGQYVDTKPASELDTDKLISMMVGREIKDQFPKQQSEIGEVVLSVRDFTKKGQFENISFDLRVGEILGFAGLMGAGRTELVETIFGIRKPDSGEIYINNKKVNIKKPFDAIKNKIAIISEDRKGCGLNLKGTVRNNISIVTLKNYCKAGVLNKKSEKEAVDSSIRQLSIKTPSRDQIVDFLSGGNQQKVVVAKWILADAKIFILDEPTRGIDVGAKSEIHALLSTLAQNGKAVIMVSSELPEVLGMCDRVIVMHEGKATGELSREEMSQELIMKYATGHKEVI